MSCREDTGHQAWSRSRALQVIPAKQGWALVDPHYPRFAERNRWDTAWAQDQEQFRRSGKTELEAFLAPAVAFGLPRSSQRALDFGCGLGRVTIALASRFDHVLGLDVSPTPICEARRLHQHLGNVELRSLNDPANIDERRFDLVWSVFGLQFLPTSSTIAKTLSALARGVKPGGLLAVEIPHALPPLRWNRLVAVSTRLVSQQRDQRSTSSSASTPKRTRSATAVHPLREEHVRQVLTANGLRVLDVYQRNGSDRVRYRRYLATPQALKSG